MARTTLAKIRVLKWSHLVVRILKRSAERDLKPERRKRARQGSRLFLNIKFKDFPGPQIQGPTQV